MENALLQEKVLLGAKFRPRPKTARERAVDRWFTKRKPHLTLGCASDLVLHTDHLGTPQLVTDNTQAIVWQADYKPFGEVNITTETISNNLRFPGQYFDGETNLHYNYFRDYDPATGRYIESDPVGLDGGFNTYGYVDQNTIRFVDPLGLVRWSGSSFGISIGVVVGATFTILDLVSECACGKKYRIRVIGTGPILTRGIKGSVTESFGLSLDDGLPCPDPNVFNGTFASTSAAATFGGIPIRPGLGRPISPVGFGKPGFGVSFGASRYGGIGLYPSRSKPVTGIAGIDASVSAGYGRSTVTNVEIERCCQ